MFEKIKSFILDIRIKYDYPRYEKEQLAAHRAEGERRFDTSQLQAEADTIKRRAQLIGDEQCAAQINHLRRELAHLELLLRETRSQKAIFERDYKAELDELYRQKKQLLTIKDELFAQMRDLQGASSIARDGLNNAYEDLRQAKERIDRWYRNSKRTPWLLGNGGKRLPEHSLFGQSFGDLEAAKNRRGAALRRISERKISVRKIREQQANNKRERDKNQADIRRIFDDIATVKAARQRMFDLSKSGVTYELLRQKFGECLSTQAKLQCQFSAMESQRNKLVEESEFRLGLNEREAVIDDLAARRTRYNAEFHSEQSKVDRLDQHRRQWLTKNG